MALKCWIVTDSRGEKKSALKVVTRERRNYMAKIADNLLLLLYKFIDNKNCEKTVQYCISLNCIIIIILLV